MRWHKGHQSTFDRFIFGNARLECDADELISVLNILLSMGECYSDIRSDERSASVGLAYVSAIRASRLCRAAGIEVEVVLLSGIPYYFGRLMQRPGLIAGFLFAVLIISLGSGVIWDIRLSKGEEFDAAEMKALLAEYGVKPGARISRLDIGDIQTRIAFDSGDIAWISINVIGTVAYVEAIAEIKTHDQDDQKGDGANLVAVRDGVIVGYELIAGEPTAEIGRTVKKGELVASGLYDSERLGFRATRAEGKVFARTEYRFSVEIPYTYTVRELSESKICEISAIFFSFRQKFFKKGGFSGTKYDKIYSDIYIYSSGDATIPIGLAVTRASLYAERSVSRTPLEAVDLAYFKINHDILVALGEADILSKSFVGSESTDGTAYTLECLVVCIEDIAEQIPFYINP